MKWIILSAIVVAAGACRNGIEEEIVSGAAGERFQVRVVADQLSDPWEITYGPDNYLWVTESKGYRVSRINPADGSRRILLDLNQQKNFPRYDQIEKGKDAEKPWPQGGLMGLALHPNLQKNQPYVYLSYVYEFKGADQEGKGCEENFGGCFFTLKIVRYTYEATRDTLINPEVICDTIPASNDHNGGRMTIAEEGGKSYLYYAIGEMGAGQFDNAGRPNNAQDVTRYEGKILRFNADPDSDSGSFDKWIPNDNPFNQPLQNAVWSYGHRNPQGLAFTKGHLYSVEHGPYSDDEVNVIEKGMNYGHPVVIGYDDGNYNNLAAGASEHKQLPGIWHTTYPTIVSEQGNSKALGEVYRNPIKSLYPTPNNKLTETLTQSRDGKQVEWTSEAPSSVDVYTSSTIPGWQNSLLIPTLKTGKLIRLKLNAAGSAVEGDTLNYFKDKARYRDLAISADGRSIFIAIDSSAQSSGPTEGDKKKSSCRGCIVEFRYTTTQ